MPGDAIVNFTKSKTEWGKQYSLEKNYSKGEISELWVKVHLNEQMKETLIYVWLVENVA